MNATALAQTSTDNVAMRCPHCGNEGTFTWVGQPDVGIDGHQVGHRKCPNPSCNGYVFVIRRGQEIVAILPPLQVAFNRQGIPTKVLATFDEAVGCQANQFWMAAGMMVRKTLEEICEDQGATGNDLKARIAALGQKIVIPTQLLEGMTHLRFLGNDAAHVDIKHFQAVSATEIEVAVELTTEILRAVYQYSHLLSRLESLRADPNA